MGDIKDNFISVEQKLTSTNQLTINTGLISTRLSPNPPIHPLPPETVHQIVWDASIKLERHQILNNVHTLLVEIDSQTGKNYLAYRNLTLACI